MSRTVLAGLALVVVIGCGSGEKGKKGPAAGSPAAGAEKPAAKTASAKKKGTAKPDTTPAKNPLTN
jgi:hypothetical protein